MKNTDKPLLCQGCKLENSDNVWCAGYALRCALNDFKREEYNYECIYYIPKEKQ